MFRLKLILKMRIFKMIKENAIIVVFMMKNKMLIIEL